MKGRLGALALIGLAAPAAAAGVLPLDGAYGNLAGCHLFATGQQGADMVLVTPDTALWGMTGCDFDDAQRLSETQFAVTGVCSTTGRPPILDAMLQVEFRDSRLTLSSEDITIGPLLPCLLMLEEGVDA